MLSSLSKPGIMYWYRDGHQLYRTATSGEIKYWYTDGKLAIQELYKSKKLEKCTKWYPNGQIRERSFYRNRELEGEHKEWNENGHPCVQEFYRNGKLDGKSRAWNHETGQLIKLESYRNGKREGECKYFYKGTFEIGAFYRNNEFVHTLRPSTKLAFLQVDRRRRNRIVIRSTNRSLISDLAKIVSRFV